MATTAAHRVRTPAFTSALLQPIDQKERISSIHRQKRSASAVQSTRLTAGNTSLHIFSAFYFTGTNWPFESVVPHRPAVKRFEKGTGLTKCCCCRAMASTGSGSDLKESDSGTEMTVLFVEMGVGYDQHG
jgi:hypothetical protein